jgi:hypothetical protein
VQMLPTTLPVVVGVLELVHQVERGRESVVDAQEPVQPRLDGEARPSESRARGGLGGWQSPSSPHIRAFFRRCHWLAISMSGERRRPDFVGTNKSTLPKVINVT